MNKQIKTVRKIISKLLTAVFYTLLGAAAVIVLLAYWLLS